jgi:hypothetical protein
MNQREGQPINLTNFGEQSVRTKIYWVLPAETPSLDVAGMLEEARAELAAESGAERELEENKEAWVL